MKTFIAPGGLKNVGACNPAVSRRLSSHYVFSLLLTLCSCRLLSVLPNDGANLDRGPSGLAHPLTPAFGVYEVEIVMKEQRAEISLCAHLAKLILHDYI